MLSRLQRATSDNKTFLVIALRSFGVARGFIPKGKVDVRDERGVFLSLH
jgi:hypothetical protein